VFALQPALFFDLVEADRALVFLQFAQFLESFALAVADLVDSGGVVHEFGVGEL
jgi:hypothetical protein